MPSVSKSQRRLFGMVDAYKHHKLHTNNEELHQKVKEMARDMSIESVKHFSKTKENGLPEKKAVAGLAFDHHRFSTIGRFFSKALQDSKLRARAQQYHGKMRNMSGDFSLNGDITASNQVLNRFDPSSGAMGRNAYIPNTMAASARSIRPLAKSAEYYFIEGFIKRAKERGVTKEQFPHVLKLAGLNKKAILPLIIDALGALGGGALGGALADGMVGRAVAGRAGIAGAKTLPPFMRGGSIERGLANFGHTAENDIPKGGIIPPPKGLWHQIPNQAGMMAGMAAAAPVTGAINRQMFPEETNINLPPEQDPQYTT